MIAETIAIFMLASVTTKLDRMFIRNPDVGIVLKVLDALLP